MAGGLMQLVAYGAQDVFLTGNPKVTFFQAVYKRHTNFAMETIEQTVNGSASNSGRVSVTVARNGDLIGEMFLELTTKVCSSSNVCWVAERAIEDIELSIGGQRIDKHYQRWWRLYSELYLDESKKVNYGKMTSNADFGVSHQVYLPLIFFFNRNPGLYLPLIALQYHEVRLDFDLSSTFTTFFDTSLKVWGNYVYLDTEERRRFAQKGHEYLIEQVQHTGNDSLIPGSSKQVRLSYNHPIKELVWCVSNTAVTGEKALWNLSSNVSANVAILPLVGGSVPTTWGSGCPMLVTPFANEEADGPVSTFKLILNGQDRFKEQDGKYFNQVQPYYHHSGCPMPGVYSYSFALKPEEHQPTGTCNFSRIDNAQVDLTTLLNNQLEMFAVNYNVLRIQSGMGGLAFSN
jgi:hypothetical protein